MLGSFDFLKSRPGREPESVAELQLTPETMRSAVLVRDTHRRKYYVFDRWDHFWAHARRTPPAERCFDEVILGDSPQRLKFDIDAPEALASAISPETVGIDTAERDQIARELFSLGLVPDDRAGDPTPAELIHAALELVIEAVLDEVHAAYHVSDLVSVAREDLALLDSSRQTPDGWKFSYHLVVLPFAVASCEEAREFTARVAARLPPDVRRLLDEGVNRSTQNFRLPGSAKPGSDRLLEPTDSHRTAVRPHSEMVVVPRTDIKVVGQRADAKRPAPEEGAKNDLDPDETKRVLGVVRGAGLLEAHTLGHVTGELLVFRRVRPSMCDLCKRCHTHDNTLLVVAPLDRSGSVRSVIARCRKAPDKSVQLGAVQAAPGAALPPGAPVRSSRLEARIEAIRTGRVDPHDALRSAFEDLPPAQRLVYSEDKMRSYGAHPTLVIKAQMGLGKTRQLRAHIDREFPRVEGGALREPVIRLVTFRQTFSKSLREGAFPDFTLYSDCRGLITPAAHPRLIIQVESLHRLEIGPHPEPVDLLVLDEVESVLAQFSSGLHRDFNASFAAFQWMLRTARRVICMDANVGDRTYRTLEKFRPAHPIRFHWNRFRRAAGDSYRFTTCPDAWLASLLAELEAGRRVVAPMNSLIDAEALVGAVRERWPEKKVRLYCSTTPQRVKTEHFADVHTFWGDLDLLVYTPTVSAGVSFEAEHFDVLYGKFSDASCDVETCRQMLGRVRSLRSRTHVICLRGIPRRLPTTPDAIRAWIANQRDGLRAASGRGNAQMAFSFEYTDAGEVRRHESPFFSLWVESVRVENLSKNDFVARFVDQVADTGAAVDVLEALDGRPATEFKDLRELARQLGAEQLAAADDIGHDAAVAIETRLRDPANDVSEEESRSFRKYRLRGALGWHGRPVTAVFVADFSAPRVMRIFKNLRRILAAPSPDAALRRIQSHELRRHTALLDQPGDRSLAEGADLLQRYVYLQHLYAMRLLAMCGFRDVLDEAIVHPATAETSMRVRKQWLAGALDMIAAEFGLRLVSPHTLRALEGKQFVSAVVRVTNAVAGLMYGVRVRSRAAGLSLEKKEAGLFDFRRVAPNPGTGVYEIPRDCELDRPTVAVGRDPPPPTPALYALADLPTGDESDSDD